MAGAQRHLAIEVRCRPAYGDPRATALLTQAHQQGVGGPRAIEPRRIYLARLAHGGALDDLLGLIHQPLLHEIAVADGVLPPLAAAEPAWVVDVLYRPGVLDPEGDGVTTWWARWRPAGPALTLHTGTRYLLYGDLTRAETEALALGQLYNPLVQTATVYHTSTPPAGDADAVPTPPGDVSGAQPEVTTAPLGGLDADALAALSRARLLALSVAELQAMQAYFAAAGREPTDAELETFALTWSEHCCHKTFRAPIVYTEVDADGRERTHHIDDLLRSTIMRATRQLNRSWVRSTFADNAGLITFDAERLIAIKVETHNHPSAIEPFGGANTGVGGVIRDVLAVSARPIALTDVLCFGRLERDDAARPAGVLPPRRVAAGVVAGVADYGNKMGVPVVSGAVLFDDGYAANPLVFCGCIGLAPADRPTSPPQPGDLVVVIGGRTGRDGVHGATFSSSDLDAAEAATLGSVVQIGEPIVEKRVGDALERLRDAGLYRALTDCGAGGLCSAVGELGAPMGVAVDLRAVPLKYPGLRPWEIWLSESQERMVLAVPPDRWPAAEAILAQEGVEAAVLGHFTGDGWLRVAMRGTPVVDLPMALLHGGRPRATLLARWQAPPSPPTPAGAGPARAELGDLLLRLLAHPTIASKAEVIRRYDHEVQGATRRGPLGDGPADAPADAAILAPAPGSRRGLAVACGVNPWYGRIDPYGAALLAVEEALRNLVAAGGDPRRAALLDNFAWGNPTRPETLGALVRAARGCHDAAIGLRVPFISGKDSLYNEYRDPQGGVHAIPGTLLITGVTIVPDLRRTPGIGLHYPGDLLYVVGATQPQVGGSHLALLQPEVDDGALPPLDLQRSRATLHALAGAVRRGLVRACHDLSEGGLAVALAEMTLGGPYGLRLDLDRLPSGGPTALSLPVALFAETPSRFAVAVDPAMAAAFEAVLAGLPCACCGVVDATAGLTITEGGQVLLDLSAQELRRAWQTPLGVVADAGEGLRG